MRVAMIGANSLFNKTGKVLVCLVSASIMGLVAPRPADAASCVMIADATTGRVLVMDGDICAERYTPASSFKLPLALMGYDSGILVDDTSPMRKYKPEYKAWREVWKQDTQPKSWLRDSVVWYSQELTRELGAEKFGDYLKRFGYGNQDLTGSPDRSEPITHAWLSSSLKISAMEQTAFLVRMLNDKLAVSPAALEATTAIMPQIALPSGWIGYGKTGTGLQTDHDGSLRRDRQIGWFIGWAQNGSSKLAFVKVIRDDEKQSRLGGIRARNGLISEVSEYIKNPDAT